MKFHENPLRAGAELLRGDGNGQTYMAKLIVVFRSFGNAPKSTRPVVVF